MTSLTEHVLHGRRKPSTFRRRKPPLDLSKVPMEVEEVMRGYYHQYPPTALIPHTFLPKELQVPDADQALVRAAGTLRRATGPAILRSRCAWSRQISTRMALLHGLVTDGDTQFYYYVGGRFVASELLGFGVWQDIDVWTQPCPVRGVEKEFRIAAGRGIYPVKITAVSDMETFIESADLHIASCAILCCKLPDGTCGFELYMTKNCAMAYKQRAVHSCVLHPALANAPGVRNDIVDYLRRGAGTNGLPSFLAYEHDEQASEKGESGRPAAFVTRFSIPPCTSCTGGWWLELRDGRMCNLSFSFIQLAEEDINEPASLPVVCYPCSEPGSDTVQDLPPDRHWLYDLLLEGTENALVGFRGGARLHTTSLLPEWLIDRMHLSRTELERELRQQFGAWLCGEDCGRIPFPCSLPIRMLALMRNWSEGTCSPASSVAQLPFKNTWCCLFDAPWQESLRSVMFCRETGKVNEDCGHCLRRDYVLHGSMDL